MDNSFLPSWRTKSDHKASCIPADEEAELCEDSEPDIIRADSQRVVFVIAFQDSMHKAIPLWLHVLGCGAQGGVDDVFSALKCFWTCATQEVGENETDGMLFAFAKGKVHVTLLQCLR